MTNFSKIKWFDINKLPENAMRLPASRVKRFEDTDKSFCPRTGATLTAEQNMEGFFYLYGTWEPVFDKTTHKFLGVATV